MDSLVQVVDVKNVIAIVLKKTAGSPITIQITGDFEMSRI